jgi:hypothetical protein
LQRLKGFRKAEVKKLRMRAILPGSAVVSDGLSCFAALASRGQVVHLPIKTGGGRQSTRRPEFFWVNTVLANVKNNVLGMHSAVRPKHVPRYLAQFQWRFNRPMGLTVSIWIAQADQTASDLDRCSDIAPPGSDGSV